MTLLYLCKTLVARSTKYMNLTQEVFKTVVINYPLSFPNHKPPRKQKYDSFVMVSTEKQHRVSPATYLTISFRGSADQKAYFYFCDNSYLVAKPLVAMDETACAFYSHKVTNRVEVREAEIITKTLDFNTGGCTLFLSSN